MVVLLLLALSAPTDLSARAAFEQGSFLFKSERFEEALPYFEVAYEKSQHRPSTIFALAQCERKLKMYEQAIEHLEEFVRVAPSRQASKARRTLSEVRAERDRQPPAGPKASKGKAQSNLQKLLAKRQAKKGPSDTREFSGPLPRVERGGSVAAGPKPAALVTEPKDDKDDSIFASPVTWVVAGTVTAGVLLSGGDEPYGGSSDIVLRP